MKCKKTGCQGSIENGTCQQCGASGHNEPIEKIDTSAGRVIASLKQLLTPGEIAPSKEDLARAADMLQKVTPYNYEAWRLHTDLLLNALSQLATRHLQPDASFTILAIPLRENDLREAAEDALRQCAHYADSAEKRIALIDEANRVRRKTWF
jgi:serine/threonine-protein kinase PknG